MKKILMRVSAFLVALVLLVSALPIVSTAATTSYSKTSNSGERDEICTSLDGTSAASYYTGAYTYDNLSEMSQSTLLTSLRTLMTSTHKYKSSYDNCRDYADQTDCENNDGRVLLLYTSYSATMSQWNGWNREHVWPKSLGGNNTSGGGADLHHIRPSDATVNSTRGNKKYGYADGGKAVNGNNPASGCLGGHYGTYFEPLDNVKGDVARIVLYVYVRWGSSWGADSVTEVFQSVDVLLEWCELDPVDTWEMGRNEVVQNIQGNRNVFIDYPELAWTLFGKEVPDDMTTPSGEAMSGSSSDGECKHKTTELRGTVAADCDEGGYTGDTYCVACGVLVRKGSDTSATGIHIFGEWQSAGEDTVTRQCKTCDKVETKKVCKHESTELRNAVAAGCGEGGYTGDICCTACDEIITKGTEISATGNHSFGAWQSKGQGNQVRECQNCDATESRNISLTCTHQNTVEKNQVAATCAENGYGYSGDVYCADCDKFLEEGARTQLLAHDWGEYSVIELSGERRMEKRTCAGCGLEDIRYVEDDLYVGVIIVCTVAVVATTLLVGGVIILSRKKKR